MLQAVSWFSCRTATVIHVMLIHCDHSVTTENTSSIHVTEMSTVDFFRMLSSQSVLSASGYSNGIPSELLRWEVFGTFECCKKKGRKKWCPSDEKWLEDGIKIHKWSIIRTF